MTDSCLIGESSAVIGFHPARDDALDTADRTDCVDETAAAGPYSSALSTAVVAGDSSAALANACPRYPERMNRCQPADGWWALPMCWRVCVPERRTRSPVDSRWCSLSAPERARWVAVGSVRPGRTARGFFLAVPDFAVVADEAA